MHNAAEKQIRRQFAGKTQITQEAEYVSRRSREDQTAPLRPLLPQPAVDGDQTDLALGVLTLSNRRARCAVKSGLGQLERTATKDMSEHSTVT